MLSQADNLTPRIKPKPTVATSSSPAPALPGPSHPPPPAFCSASARATTTSSSPDPLMTYVSQPSCLPPPLVSTGTLMQHVSMSHSPSASVVYAPLLTTTLSSTPIEENIFWLQFVKGNISRCSGCDQRNLRGVDGKPKQPPYDLCLQHKEYVIFENPHTGMHQLSSDLRNVYYHASVRCVTQKYSTFNPSTDVKVSREVRAKLSGVHLAHLLIEFGLAFLNK